MRSIGENNSTEQKGERLTAVRVQSYARPWYKQVQPRLIDGPGIFNLEEITQKSAQMTKNVQFGPEMTETISP
jgi:hypothetical protein